MAWWLSAMKNTSLMAVQPVVMVAVAAVLFLLLTEAYALCWHCAIGVRLGGLLAGIAALPPGGGVQLRSYLQQAPSVRHWGNMRQMGGLLHYVRGEQPL